MAFKSTTLPLTTTPLVIAGPNSTVINTIGVSISDPVVIWLSNQSGIPIFLTGSTAVAGATPAMFSMTSAPGDPRAFIGPITIEASDTLLAFATAASSVGIIASRQGAP